jgi:hypothetical protein
VASLFSAISALAPRYYRPAAKTKAWPITHSNYPYRESLRIRGISDGRRRTAQREPSQPEMH